MKFKEWINLNENLTRTGLKFGYPDGYYRSQYPGLYSTPSSATAALDLENEKLMPKSKGENKSGLPDLIKNPKGMISFPEAFKKKFNELNESFDTVSDFLLNPEHRNKTWNQLKDEFEASGGKIIGVGKYGQVFSHPSWSYVLKVYFDEYYTRFVRFAYRNPHPSFPKFYGPPQRVIPFYRRYKSESIQYLVRMEELLPISTELFNLINNWYNQGINYMRAVENGSQDHEIEEIIYPNSQERKAGKKSYTGKVKLYQDIIDLLKNNPKLYNVFEGLYLLTKGNIKGSFDFHQDNFMQRPNGDIVISDPLWEGSNPYVDYKRMVDMETDAGYQDYQDYPDPDVIGGKLPKKIKAKKPPKKLSNQSFDDPPF